MKSSIHTVYRNENAKKESRNDMERSEMKHDSDKATVILVRTCDARTEDNHLIKRTLGMKVTGTRPRGRPKMRSLTD